MNCLKPPKCKHCRQRMPEDQAHLRIHPDCVGPWWNAFAAKRAKKEANETKQKAKAEKAKDRATREKLKPRAKWEEECRAIVQAIARIRDRNDGCISCHLPSTWGGQWHGSHFRSHGACSALQFHLWNIHKACSSCNRDKGGNIIDYRPRLVEKIGQDRVDWLMSQNQIVRHDVDYYKRFKKVMGKRLRRLEKRYGR